MDRNDRLIELSDGIPEMPRRLTARERIADRIYLFIQIASTFLLLFTGLVGYRVGGLAGALGFAVGGVAVGIGLRRSAGIRKGPGGGFYERIRERSLGCRRGFLEMLLENVRGSAFDRATCEAITSAYDDATRDARSATTEAERKAIFSKLDKRVKQISYGPRS